MIRCVKGENSTPPFKYRRINMRNILLITVIPLLIFSCNQEAVEMESDESINSTGTINQYIGDAKINYFADFGLPNKKYQSLYQEKSIRESVIKTIEETLGVTINIINPYEYTDMDLIKLRAQDNSGSKTNYRSGKKDPELTLKKLLSDGGLDLVHFNDFRKLENAFLMEEEFTDIISLIKEYAPNIYSSYPEKYWNYRIQNKDIYGIPIRKYQALDTAGFWVIKKEAIFESFKNIEKDSSEKRLVSLIRLLDKKSDASSIKPLDMQRRHARKKSISHLDFVEQLVREAQGLVLTTTEGNYQLIRNMLCLAITPVGSSEIKVEPSNILLQYNSQDISLIKKIFRSVSGVLNSDDSQPLLNKTDFQFYLLYTDWNACYITNDYELLSMMSLEKLQDIFKSEDYIFISDLENCIKNPFDEYDYLYIPKDSPNKEITLRMLDRFWESSRWYGLLNYGNTAWEGSPMQKDIINDADWVYYGNLSLIKSPLGILADQKYKAIPSFFPKQVVEEYKSIKKRYIENTYELNGFDIYRAYNDILNQLSSEKGFGYYTRKYGGIASIVDMSYSWKNKYIEIMVPKLQERVYEYIGMRE